MSGVKNGKAFEYACLQSLYDSLLPGQDIIVEESPPLETARVSFIESSDGLRDGLISAANAATRVLTRLEPQLEYPDKNIPLYLSIQTDAQGRKGDVRDVLCIRKQNGWEIGLSCKHNHHAVKHNRLSNTIDFGKEWLGIPCSDKYFNEIRPIFDELQAICDNSGKTALWRDLKNKKERFYVPVLRAFIDELQRLYKTNQSTPSMLLHYLIGRHDFYKIITNDTKKATRIEAVNIAGSLNRPSEGKRSMINIARLRMPSTFYNIDFKKNSKTTVEVVCDEGWSVSMRLHNGDGPVVSSLKFDINLISLPNTIHAQVEPW